MLQFRSFFFISFILLHGFGILVKADAQPTIGCPGKAIIGSFDTWSGDGGPAVQAQLFNPGQMAVDTHGNVYIVDPSNNRVRKVNPAGTISTLAGNGTAASTGDGGQAAPASLNRPGGIAVDAAGNVYVSETNGNRIRKISPEGIITTYIGPSSARPSISAALSSPADLAMDSHGNLFVSDVGRLIRVAVDGTITTVVGGIGNANPGGVNGILGTQTGYGGGSIAIAPNGDLLISDTAAGNIFSIDANDVLHNVTYGPGPPPSEGANALQVSMFTYAIAIAPDGGILVVASPGVIWEVKPNGLLHQIVQNDPINGSINRIVAGPGNTVLASIGNSVYSFSASGQPTLFAGVPVTGFAGDGQPAATAALENIGGLAVDEKGNIYLSDSGNNRIRLVTPDGTISNFAGTGVGYPSSGDGGPASQAQIQYPLALTFDPFGNLYVLEGSGATDGLVVRKIATDGTITHFAGSTTPPSPFCQSLQSYCPPASGKAVDAYFDLNSLISDSKGQIFLLDVHTQMIFKVDLQGNISVFAQLTDQFPNPLPTQMQVDGSDNLYVIDPISRYSVVVSPDGNLQPFSVWTFPSGFAVDPNGNLYLGNGKILKQSPSGAVGTLFDTVVSPYSYEALFPLAVDISRNLYFGDQARNRLFEVPNAASCTGGQRPLVNSRGPLDAASYVGGLAPGQLVTIFGYFLGPGQGVGPTIVGGNRFDTQTSGVRVLFDGFPAPMLYASAAQVSAVVPYEIAGQAVTYVEVEFNGIASDPFGTLVYNAAPGIFTRDSSGQGQAAAQNQDGTPNGSSHPAPKGSTIVIFATGAGITNPASVDGAIAGASPPVPALPITATVGGMTAKVAYAGGAPFEVNGILQVNLVIPEGASSGPAVPIAIQVGTAPSQTGVTIAVQ